MQIYTHFLINCSYESKAVSQITFYTNFETSLGETKTFTLTHSECLFLSITKEIPLNKC